MFARVLRHGATQARATARTPKAGTVGSIALAIARRTTPTLLATDEPAECLDGTRIVHARSSVRPTTAGRTASGQAAPVTRTGTGTSRSARSP